MDDLKKSPPTDRIIDFIFSKDSRKYLLLIFILGFVVRFIVSLRIPFGADEIGYAAHSIGFIESGKLQIHDQDAVWFFLTDLLMKIFGVNVFGLRFLSVIFGSLSIILVYLLAKEIFNKRIALMASFILAFSSYHILFTIGQMDSLMAFFSLLAMYFLVLFLKSDKASFFVLCWVTLGIAIMVKQIAILFIPAFVLYTLFYNKKHHNNFRLKQIFFAALIIILIVTPVLTYNYLLYKDKGIVDLQFARFFRIEIEQYSSIAHTLNPFSLKTVFVSYEGGVPGLFVVSKVLYSFESVFILFFVLLGILVIANSKRPFKWLLFLSFLFPFIFLVGASLLSNHFVFTTIFFALFSAKGIDFFSLKFKKQENRKKILYFILSLILITSAIQIYQNNGGIVGSNEIAQLINFKDNSIDENSLVIVDSRIYRGRIAFMFWDKHYLETIYFPNLIEIANTFDGELIQYKTFFIEAIQDDSGWGNIKDQPEFNESTEQIVSIFKSGELIKIIYDVKGNPHFAVYRGQMSLPPGVFESVDSTHSFFFYPLGYKPKSQIFDNYQTYGVFDNLLDKLAHLILYLEVILAILLALLIFILLYKNS